MRNTQIALIGLFVLALFTKGPARTRQHCRLRQGSQRRGVARRHRRGVERRADRKDPHRRHRQRRPVPDRRSASRHLRRGRSRCPGSRPCGAKGIILQGTFAAPGQRRAAGRRTRRNHHGHRRIADRGRRQQHRRSSSSTATSSTRFPTPIRNTPSRALLLPGTTVTPFVLGQYNMSVHGSATRRHGDCHRRHARQQPVRQRSVQRLLHERRQPSKKSRSRPAPSRRRCRPAACASTARPRTAATRSPARSSPTAPAARFRPTTAPTR